MLADLRPVAATASVTITQLPASTLSRAANGSTLPRWETVAAYAQACGADPATIRPSWEKARARHPKRRTAPRTGPFYPNQVTTVNDLISALRHLRVRAGQLTLLKIEQITAANGARLPRSTTSDLLRGKLRAPSLQTVLAFAQACDLARETNTSIDAIRDVLAARRRPSAQFARDLAHATGTPAEQLLTDLGWLPGLPQGGPS